MLAEALRQLREERRLNPTDLARLSGVSRTRLYALEGGQGKMPQASTLLKLAKGLSAWRTGEVDTEESADIFRRLERAAGYPVSVSEDQGGIPDELEGRFRRIAARWPHLTPRDQETVDQILGVASNLGSLDARPPGHTLASLVNGSPIKDTANYNYTEHRNLDFGSFAPLREPAIAGR